MRAYAAALAVMAAALWLNACATVGGKGRFITSDAYPADKEDARPWTHLNFANDPRNFQFAVITDNTALHREGVLPAILAKVNLMQPEFVLSVGDYIEGYTTDKAQLLAEWAEIDRFAKDLEAPLFFVVGNHDVSNDIMEKHWLERAGRTYYSFRYKDAVFLALNTEDPPPTPTSEEEAESARIAELGRTKGRKAAMRAFTSSALMQSFMAKIDTIYISDAQRNWALDVLARNKDVRWTFVFMHKPAWQHESQNFMAIEGALAGRGYTMFAGHEHNYKYIERNGQDYMRLGTSGGVWIEPSAPGNMDHITWVTMRDNGPVFAHLVATGILAKDGVPDFIPGAELCGALYKIPCVYSPKR